MSYTQGNEEEVILRELGAKPGRLLDVGAHGGKLFSNSLRLIEMGWSGVLVEPAPGPFSDLLKLHDGNPRVTAVNCALAAKAGFAMFQDSSGDAVSTLSDEHAVKWSAAGIHWRPYMLWTVTPMQLLAHVGGCFEMISIDTESTNWEVFGQFDWPLLARQGLRMLVIEHDGHQHGMEATMAPLGFERCYESAENLIFRRR